MCNSMGRVKAYQVRSDRDFVQYRRGCTKSGGLFRYMPGEFTKSHSNLLLICCAG